MEGWVSEAELALAAAGSVAALHDCERRDDLDAALRRAARVQDPAERHALLLRTWCDAVAAGLSAGERVMARAA